MSLLTNAIDAMSDSPADQAMVFLATERVGNFAKLSVLDKGPGIPREKLTEIFAPFYSTKKDRMGMGLTIARTIVEEHGGRIEAENAPNGGAAFYILLPLATIH